MTRRVDTQQSFQLRNALVPYIYTAAYDTHVSGILAAHPVHNPLGTLPWHERVVNHAFECDTMGVAGGVF
jgi:hypothetical protein